MIDLWNFKTSPFLVESCYSCKIEVLKVSKAFFTLSDLRLWKNNFSRELGACFTHFHVGKGRHTDLPQFGEWIGPL